MSLEEPNMIYKPFLERIMGHIIFKSEFEIIYIQTFLPDLFMCLNAC